MAPPQPPPRYPRPSPDPVLRAAFYHDLIDFADRALGYNHISPADHARVLYAVAQALNANGAFPPLPVDALSLPPHPADAPSTRPTDQRDLDDLARGTTHTAADGSTAAPESLA